LRAGRKGDRPDKQPDCTAYTPPPCPWHKGSPFRSPSALLRPESAISALLVAPERWVARLSSGGFAGLIDCGTGGGWRGFDDRYRRGRARY